MDDTFLQLTTNIDKIDFNIENCTINLTKSYKTD